MSDYDAMGLAPIDGPEVCNKSNEQSTTIGDTGQQEHRE